MGCRTPSVLRQGAAWAAAASLLTVMWLKRRQIWACIQHLLPDALHAAQLDTTTSAEHLPLLELQPDVKELGMSGQQLTSLPSKLWAFDWLQRLDLSRNRLTVVPPEIGTLRSLTALNLSGNALAALPPQIGALQQLADLNVASNELTALPCEIGALRSLVYLNVMANRLAQLPEELGNLTALYRLGLKSNRLAALPASIGNLRSLVELFITDNELVALPEELGRCSKLVKLQASFNRLSSLPRQLCALPRLELMRVAVNIITEVPQELASCPSLAWMSLGGNPACAEAPPPRSQIRTLTMDQLDLGRPLGDGASGDVFAAMLDGRDVAVKVFKGETSPDGQASDEIAVTCHVDHPNLSKVIATIEQPHSLVLQRVFGDTLALKPNLQVLLRCRWADGISFPLATVASIGAGVASALAYLHQECICHGDVYAHNIVVDTAGHATLLDYGASFFYKPGTLPYEAQEVRAFGLFLADMVARVQPSSHAEARRALADIVMDCLLDKPLQRPGFKALAARLADIKQGVHVQ